MISNKIRQGLLENEDLTLASTVEKARTLELAQRNAQSLNSEYLQQTLAKPNCSETSKAPKPVLLNLSYSAAHILPRICFGAHFSSELRNRHNCEQQNYKKQ